MDRIPVDRWKTWSLRVAPLAVYLGLALVATWPLPKHMHDSLPLGMEPVATVPLFVTWSIWWNCNRLKHGYADYWQAPIFHPAPDTFALSEPLPLTALGLPLLAVTGSRALLYNTLLLLSLTLNGFCAFHLLRRVRLRPWPALAGGALVEVLPFVFNELGVLQLVPLFGILLTIRQLFVFSIRPTLGRGALVGLAFALTYYLCSYYGLFLAVALPLPGLWLLGRRLLQPRTWGWLALGAVLAACLIAPLVQAQLRVGRVYPMKRPMSLLVQLSAQAKDYAVPPWQPWCGLAPLAEYDRVHIHLLPGWIKYGLAAVGIAAGLWRRRLRRWTVFCVLLLLTGFLLSLGPNLRLGSWAPYEQLMEWVPGLDTARNVFRFAVFAQLAIALLAAAGLQTLGHVGPLRWPSLKRKAATVTVAAMATLLAAGALAELWPPRQELFQLAPARWNREWLSYLKYSTEPESVVACVPFPTGITAEAYEATTLWMYWGTFHERRMVNGYSGFFPQSFLDLKEAMAQFPNAESLRQLQAAGVDYCVVMRALWTPEALATHPDAAGQLQLVFADEEAQIDIYQLSDDPLRRSGE